MDGAASNGNTKLVTVHKQQRENAHGYVQPAGTSVTLLTQLCKPYRTVPLCIPYTTALYTVYYGMRTCTSRNLPSLGRRTTASAYTPVRSSTTGPCGPWVRLMWRVMREVSLAHTGQGPWGTAAGHTERGRIYCCGGPYREDVLPGPGKEQ